MTSLTFHGGINKIRDNQILPETRNLSLRLRCLLVNGVNTLTYVMRQNRRI